MNQHPLLQRFRIVPTVSNWQTEGDSGIIASGEITTYVIADDFMLPIVGAGYGSKFHYLSNISEGAQRVLGNSGLMLFEAKFQNPGKHKYDLLQAFYLVDPKTWNAVRIGPITETRQVSSVEVARDAYETGLKLMAMLYLSTVGGAALSAYIGALVVPQAIATAYPALVQVVGQVALQTVVNGGDVEKAVESVAVGYLGSIAGGYVSGLTDSQLIGKLAGTATGALLRGDDVETAVKNAAPTLLLQSGINAMEIAFTEPQPSFDVSVSDQPAFTADYDPWGFNFDTVQPAPAPEAAHSIADFNFGGSFGDSFGNAYNLTSSDAYNLTTSEVQTLAPAPVSGTLNETNFWDFARDALKILPMFVNRNVPQPQPAQRYGTTNPASYPVGQPVTLPDGRVVTRTPEGMLVTVNTNGSVTQSRMPIGSMATSPAAGGLGATLSAVPPWAWGLGAAALIFALRRR